MMDTKIYKERMLLLAAISNAKDELITPDAVRTGCSAEIMNGERIAASL